MKWTTLCLIFTSFFANAQYELGETVITFNDPDRDREIETFIYYPAMEAGENTEFASEKFPVFSIGHVFAMSY